MSLIKCPNGHLFSARRYGSICPYCNMEAKNQDDGGPVWQDKRLSKEEAAALEEALLNQEADPVCGWLVCRKGAKPGKDYRIHTGKNFVGRGDDMDIQIVGDNRISKRNHAILVYDPKKRNFVLLPGDSSGITYLNEEAVYVPTPLNPYDVVEMGESQFIFLPFCGEHFEWDDKA